MGGSSKDLGVHDDLDIIIKYKVEGGDVPMTPKLEEKMNRLEFCDDMIRQFGSRRKVIPLLVEKYHISRRSAYRIFQETQELYGSTSTHDKKYWVDIIVGEILATKQKAKDSSNLKIMAQCDKNLVTAVDKLMPDDANKPYESLQLPNIELGHFPEILEVEVPEDLDEQIEKIKKQAKLQLHAGK